MDIRSYQDALRAYGVRDVGGLSNPNLQPYTYILNWNTDIANGGSGQAQKPIDNGWIFIIKQTDGVIFTSAAAGVVIAGTPAYRTANTGVTVAPGAGSTNTWASFDHFRVFLQTNQATWMSDPVRAGLVMGDALNPSYWLDGIVVPPGATIQGTLFNDTPAASAFNNMRGMLAMRGLRVRVP